MKTFMREQDSKYETESFMKLANNIMLTKMSTKAGIEKFGEKAVVSMVKYYIQIDKGATNGKPFVTPIDPDKSSYK